MNISFKPLSSDDFPKLLQWLNAPHVQKWWDKFVWTMEMVKDKYTGYIESEDINCYIINLEEKPIGLIQIYKVDKFPPAKHKAILPKNIWGVDMFIGEESLLGKGIGSAALKLFIEKYADFEYLLIDPHKDNLPAIKTYQKCGFEEIVRDDKVDEIWMMRKG